MPAIDAAAVRKVLDEFATAYTAKDVDATMSFFTRDPDAVLVGTGGDEVRRGPEQLREQVERDLGQADRIELVLGDVQVSGRGDVAWTFAEPVATVTVGGEEIRMPMRMTLVLVTEDGDWRIHSGHLSVALAGQQAGESYASV